MTPERDQETRREPRTGPAPGADPPGSGAAEVPRGESAALAEDPLPLDALRARIDEIDRGLVALLGERAAVVVEVGKAKRGTGVPIYVPHREKEVIERILSLDRGPLPARTIEAIWRELMSGSFALELPLRIGYLGPAGSFSHLAAIRHFGSSVELADLHEIEAVFREVAAGRCHYGLVPYENSLGGAVTETLDAFQQHRVTIYAEALVEVNHALLANCEPEAILRICSKPEALGQCRRWLGTRFPGVELVPEASTSAAARRAAKEPGTAAIASTLAGELYGVHPVFERVQDKPDNITRFLVIGRDAAKPTGEDRTTIMFTTAHRPGALVDVLAVFRDARINLSHIEKRPSGRTNWEYTFFIDCDAHRDQPEMAAAIRDASGHCVALTVLGSYPRALRVL
ncbi:MAG TPA: prephenate dehydratase [Phycisphaerales bacterium]|nr:prephenate dehydratase [Phycisphaerales bacterium]HMP38476.1 prephenate dehydratase [Phycisphaerales bacterium]